MCMCLSSVETGKSVDMEQHSINDVSEQQSKVRYDLAFQIVVPSLVSSIPRIIGRSGSLGSLGVHGPRPKSRLQTAGQAARSESHSWSIEMTQTLARDQ